jgi:5-methylcytosine-specific restriction protein A
VTLVTLVTLSCRPSGRLRYTAFHIMKTLKPRIQTLRTSAAVVPSCTQRTRGSAWVKLRRETMADDSGLCRACAAAGRVRAGEEVDHIVPLHLGGTDDRANRQLLCRECHGEKSAQEAGDRRAGGG